MTAKTAAITLRDISKVFSSVAAVASVSLDIAEGEVACPCHALLSRRPVCWFSSIA